MANKQLIFCFILSAAIAVLTGPSFAWWCPPADLDGDCWVTIEDLQIFTDQWLTGGECENDQSCADFDGMNTVDFADFLLLANSWQTSGSTLFINEFMASNSSDSGIHDPAGDYDDWIEIYNFGDTPIRSCGNVSDR